MLAGARWHSAGRPIVYTAEHPALALLEALVHFDRSLMPSHYQLLSIELPDADVEGLTDRVLTDPLLADPVLDAENSRRIGDAWLEQAASLSLRVPSFVAPHSWNYLINPRHPRIAEARIAKTERWPFDDRLS